MKERTRLPRWPRLPPSEALAEPVYPFVRELPKIRTKRRMDLVMMLLDSCSNGARRNVTSRVASIDLCSICTFNLGVSRFVNASAATIVSSKGIGKHNSPVEHCVCAFVTTSIRTNLDSHFTGKFVI